MSDRDKCPECGWKIDHEYSRCLHCGARLDGKKDMDKGIIVKTFLALIVITIIVWNIIPSKNSSDKKNTINSSNYNLTNNQTNDNTPVKGSMLSIPSFEIIKEKTTDTKIKTQVSQRIWVKNHIKPKYLRALLKYQYKKIENKGGFKYHSKPTNVFIYIHDSKQSAEDGGTKWVAALMKGYHQNEPDIKINKKQIKQPHKPSKGNKFGFTLSKRREIYKEIMKADNRATNEAVKKIPNNINKQIDLEDKLRDKYELKVAKKYKVTKAQLDSIALEGGMNQWPWPN